MDVVVREDAANGLLDEDLYLVFLFRLSDCKLLILVIRRVKSRGADEFFSFFLGCGVLRDPVTYIRMCRDAAPV